MTTAVKKDRSMDIQKAMLAAQYEQLARADAEGRKTAYTFVPGNLTELLLSFDILPVLPEINALQNAMRKKSASYIATAEKLGHSEDVCTYVKADVGMLKSGNVGPTGARLPDPSILLLSYTGCFTFMKWFELLEQEYDCPIVMLQVPYQAGGRVTPSMRSYVVRQLEEKVIPQLERVTGRAFDIDRSASSRCWSQPSTSRLRSTATSAVSTTSRPSSLRSAGRTRRSATTTRWRRRSESGWPGARGR
jgi:benzoyl-CoA reductase subunit B